MAYINPDGLNEIGLLWVSVPLMIGLSMCNLYNLLNFERPLT